MRLPSTKWTVQPLCNAAQEQHARFADYCTYRAGLADQGLVAAPFERWLDETERYEMGFVSVVNVTIPGARLSTGWHIHVYGPCHRLTCTMGPFTNKPTPDSPLTLEDRHG